MQTTAFDYELPHDRIAQQPLEQRDAARLLVDRGVDEHPEHRSVRDLPTLLEPGDVLVINDTRVLPARLHLTKQSGGSVEVLLLERDEEGWEALVRPSRRVPAGTRLRGESPTRGGAVIEIDVFDDLGEGRRRVRFVGTGNHDDELGEIEAFGEMPLPPYINERLIDSHRYQTIYSQRPLSAAAPTAGLHFTDALLAAVRRRGVEVVNIELAIGLDTFRPIAADTIEGHVMHSEWYRVPAATMDLCENAHANGHRVVSVGTTVVRSLESAAATGELEGRTDLFIHGNYPFRVVDTLLTNFHLPRSSLLVLIDAFIGPHWRDIYKVAVDQRYRFLSFGDAMLLQRRA